MITVAQPIPMRRADNRARFASSAENRIRQLVLLFLIIGAILVARVRPPGERQTP